MRSVGVVMVVARWAAVRWIAWLTGARKEAAYG